ncbi:MAG: deoxyribodipyrimidine photo-lyase [Salinivirgaceae bacterium]|nr:deoxyribodipyrimidine photo-lyase [Salinivirgaceae bacterium]
MMNLFWFRRDLRLQDNCALYYALKENKNVQAIFIFDTEILDDLEIKEDRRISFIYETIQKLKNELNKLGADLWVFYGNPMDIINTLTQKHSINSIYLNRDYEPYATTRDAEIEIFCNSQNITFKTFKDQVIFEKLEIAKADGKPYTVFTPYMKKWKINLNLATTTKAFPTKIHFENFNKISSIQKLISVKELGFVKVPHIVPKLNILHKTIKEYHVTRDLLAIEGTSRLSVHLRFGTISIRELVKVAMNTNETYLNELIWREFYMQILWNFPQIVSQNFKKKYNGIEWNTNEEDFEKWCSAHTGYPIVDAAMNQLLQTGFMHNRARMIVASFLTKHLLIDWRKGEAFFAKHLSDYELSSNNGGWQWAASTGCDAVPYFRIFNPYIQTERFDNNQIYIKKWGGEQGIEPIVDHKEARERCLQVYSKALTEYNPN